MSIDIEHILNNGSILLKFAGYMCCLFCSVGLSCIFSCHSLTKIWNRCSEFLLEFLSITVPNAPADFNYEESLGLLNMETSRYRCVLSVIVCLFQGSWWWIEYQNGRYLAFMPTHGTNSHYFVTVCEGKWQTSRLVHRYQTPSVQNARILSHAFLLCDS